MRLKSKADGFPQLLNDSRKDPAARLQLAVVRYMKSKGYSLLVIGEVAIRSWADRPFQLEVSVKCTGKKLRIVKAEGA